MEEREREKERLVKAIEDLAALIWTYEQFTEVKAGCKIELIERVATVVVFVAVG